MAQNLATRTSVMSAVLKGSAGGLARQQALNFQYRTASTALPMTRMHGNRSPAPHDALHLSSTLSRWGPFATLTTRNFCTSLRTNHSGNIRPASRVGTVGLSLHQRRTLFGSPSHDALARLELAANKSPNSTVAQAAFYLALLRADMPQIIIDRYRTGQFATNAATDTAYRQACAKVGQPATPAQSAQNQLGKPGITSEQLQVLGQAVGAQLGGGQIAKAASGSGNKSDPVYVVIEESLRSTIFKWARWMLTFGFSVYVALVVVSLLVENTGMLKKVGGQGNAEIRPEHQTARFSDVHGCDEAKEELTDVVDFLKNPDRYNKLGGRLPKGMLLVGPPGTGKTLLARAVAGEAGVPFFYMSGSEFDEVYVGVGAKRVRELFTAARSKAPAIVFIDELDAIGGKRSARDASYNRQTLNQLLNDLDGFDQTTGVVFIAATNHPELLDKALLRPGRFDRHVRVELPDVRGRIAILKHHTKKIRLAPDVDLTSIARGTPGFSGAELENLANTAAVQASKKQSKFVSALDLEWAKDKIMMGAEHKSKVVPLKERLQTAYHEGGHALVGIFGDAHKEIHKATILPRGHAAGITFFLPNEDTSATRSQYRVDLQISLGGKMAEEIVYGQDKISAGASADISNATNLAYTMVTMWGFSDALGNVDFNSHYSRISGQTRHLIDNEVRRIIDEAQADAKKLLISKRKELDLLAKALVQYETLDKDEILKVIKGEKLNNRLMSSPDADIKIPTYSPVPMIPPPPSENDDGGSDPPGGAGVPV